MDRHGLAALAAACPDCGTVSSRLHETVVTRHRGRAPGLPTRWTCDGPSGDGNARQRPARAGRSRNGCRPCRRGAGSPGGWWEQAAGEVADRGITPTEAARHAGISWLPTHDAFAVAADRVLGEPAAPVAHLGIDEHRRGRPRWLRDEQTREYVQLADRWHTCFYDLSGEQGMLGQAEGRTADDAAYWLAGATPAWRDAVQVVAIDMCSIYLSAVRRILPGAAVAVDLFHVVQQAVKTLGDERRRAIRDKYGRRGRSGDPEYGIKHLIERNLETLSPDQFAKIINTLDSNT